MKHSQQIKSEIDSAAYSLKRASKSLGSNSQTETVIPSLTIALSHLQIAVSYLQHDDNSSDLHGYFELQPIHLVNSH